MENLISARIKDDLVEIYDPKNGKILGRMTEAEAKFLESGYECENGKEIFDLTMLCISLGLPFGSSYNQVCELVEKESQRKIMEAENYSGVLGG